jgi:pimeloyl-ACP methyl ester carboxylesterase
MGSFDVRMYASRNLEKVAGLVLVDPSADDQVARMAQALPRMAQIEKAAYAPLAHCADLARAGTLTPQTAGCTRPPPPDVPAELREWVRARDGANAIVATVAELEAFQTLDAAEMARVRRPLGDIPLIVLTGRPTAPGMTPAETEALHRLWTKMHDEMAALSTVGVNRPVAGSGHYIQLEKPAVVISAVQEVVAKARAGGR